MKRAFFLLMVTLITLFSANGQTISSDTLFWTQDANNLLTTSTEALRGVSTLVYKGVLTDDAAKAIRLFAKSNTFINNPNNFDVADFKLSTVDLRGVTGFESAGNWKWDSNKPFTLSINLKEVYLPTDGPITIETGIFSGCSNLQRIYFSEKVPVLSSSVSFSDVFPDKESLEFYIPYTSKDTYKDFVPSSSKNPIRYYEDGFKPLRTISYTTSGNGSISFDVTDLKAVAEGKKVEVTLNPDEDNFVESLIINGEIITTNQNKYSFTISGDVALSVVFQQRGIIHATINGDVSKIYANELKTSSFDGATKLSLSGLWNKSNIENLRVVGDNQSILHIELGDINFPDGVFLNFKRYEKLYAVTSTGTVMGNVSISGGFNNPSLRYVDLSALNIVSGQNVFIGCSSLEYVKLGTTPKPFEDIFNDCNPNVILEAPSSFGLDHNVIINGVCENLVIADKNPFAVYSEFTAKSCTYSRKFEPYTNKDGGWDFFWLPFAPTSITYNGSQKRWVTSDQNGHFWLRKQAGSSEQKVSFSSMSSSESFQPYQPYIISVPSSEYYDEDVHLTAYPMVFSCGETRITPQYESFSNNLIGTFNLWGHPRKEQNTAGYVFCSEGISFVEASSFSPLRGMLKYNGSPSNAPKVVGMGVSTSAKSLTMDSSNPIQVISNRGEVIIESATDAKVDIFTIQGYLVKSVEVCEPEVSVELPAGLYIIAGNKVVVF